MALSFNDLGLDSKPASWPFSGDILPIRTLGLAYFTWTTPAGAAQLQLLGLVLPVVVWEIFVFSLKIFARVLVTSPKRIMPDLSTPFLLRSLSDSRELGHRLQWIA